MAVAPEDTGNESHSTSSVSSITTSFTVSASAGTLLAFLVSTNVTGSTFTYNGVGATKRGTASRDWYGTVKYKELWTLDDTFDGSAHNMVATWSGAAQDLGFTWQSFSGVTSLGTVYTNGTAPNSTSANPTLTISDWASGDYAVGSVDDLNSVTAGNTEMGNFVSLAYNDIHVSSQYETANGNLSWTASSGDWCAIGCALKGTSGQNIAVGQVTETDTAQAFTVASPISVAVGQVTETDTAQAITAVNSISIAVGQATETDTAQAITAQVGAVSVAVAQVNETDTAQAITAANGISVAVGQATETDTAQAFAVAGAISVAVAQAAETDTAQAITSVQGNIVAIGQVSETDTAQAITAQVGAISVALGQVLETDAAQAIVFSGLNVVALSQVSETDSAQSITLLATIGIDVGQVVETDSAFSITPVYALFIIDVGQATETDTANAISVVGGGVIVNRDAVAVIRDRLLNDATLLATVPATRIMAGQLPLGITLPAIMLNEISLIERKNVAMDYVGVLRTARIEVSMFASDYPTLKSLMRLVRAACTNFRGDITDLGVNVDSILPAGASPELKIPGPDIHMQSRDFMVRYSEL